jgi:hypothetical protein
MEYWNDGKMEYWKPKMQDADYALLPVLEFIECERSSASLYNLFSIHPYYHASMPPIAFQYSIIPIFPYSLIKFFR